MMLFELTSPSSERLGVIRWPRTDTFWVVRYDESLPEGWRWRACEYPAAPTLEVAKLLLYAQGTKSDAPAWLEASWRTKVDEAIAAVNGDAG